jgi:hypothetical protein
MDINIITDKLDILEREYNEKLTSLLEEIQKNIIRPYCRRYKLYFMSGNGGYSFYLHSDKNKPFFKQRILDDPYMLDTFDFSHFSDKMKQETKQIFSILQLPYYGKFDIGLIMPDTNIKRLSKGK